jgi:hypothetical protein
MNDLLSGVPDLASLLLITSFVILDCEWRGGQIGEWFIGASAEAPL